MLGPTPPPPSLLGLLAGALRPLPLEPLQALLTTALRGVLRRYPALFDRLTDFRDCLYVIEPSDLPWKFVLRPDLDAPSLAAMRELVEVEPVATIRGGFWALLDLLDGRADGDALFFSRALVIEGDVEAVVALRNALEAVEFDFVESLLTGLGPMAEPTRVMGRGAMALHERAARGLDAVRNALLAPAYRRIDGLARDLAALRQEIQDSTAAARARRAG